MPIHFVYAGGGGGPGGPAPMPLALTHDWRGPSGDFGNAIGPLSVSADYGGDPADVVASPLSGYATSTPLRTTGIAMRRGCSG